jgi:hypothetical protein
MMPALLGGLFIGVLSALPVVQLCNCCCLWLLTGGLLAAYLEQQNRPISLTVSEGARVGVIAGIVGAVVWFVVDSALAPLQARFMGELARNVRDLPPELQDWMEMVESGGGGSNVLGFLMMLVFSAIMSTIGGMIGASYFRKDVPPALGGPLNPPPLP